MRSLLLLIFALVFATCTSAQSMLEMGGMTAGSAIGSAAGKKLSDTVDKNLRKVDGALSKAAKQGGTTQKASGVPAPPSLQVSPGVPRGGGYNVPPPPPAPPPVKRAAVPAPRPTVTATRVSVPVVMSAVTPLPPPLDVNLNAIAKGMSRESLLTLGVPSSRITMSEDGHLLEIFRYRNATFAPGTVRLRDGAVASVEARP